MAEKGDIVFKSEDSLWQTLKEGRKTWDARLHDISDDRIYRLSWGKWEDKPPHGRQPVYLPQETFVHFLNKKTGQLLRFRFRGLEFAPWAPGWCFIGLGGLVSIIEPDGHITLPGE
ncbi:MAG: hypothetical protein GH143_02550 [Calditrichaeota bacterium]|nr:hypothetical protein [Calditrichota bacterium]